MSIIAAHGEGESPLFLKRKGLNDYAAAGIMGNLYAESGLSTTNLENYYESKIGMTDREYTESVDKTYLRSGSISHSITLGMQCYAM